MRYKKRRFEIESSGSHRLLRDQIFLNIPESAVMTIKELPNRREKEDAVEQLLKNAVRKTPFVTFSGIPHIFDEAEGIYVSFGYMEFELAIYDAMRKARIPNGCYGNVMKVIKLCWAECQSRKYSTDSSIVVFSNCVYDTMDGTANAFHPKYLTNMKVDYPYNPMDTPVMWMSFLNDVLPDPEMQKLLQEFIAAAYIDRNTVKFEHMLILLGSGSNGKSVVFEIVQALLGEENISNFSIKDLISNGRTEQNIAMCNGKRMNYCSEIRTTEINEKNSDALKSIVSGEAQMARSLYKEPFRATEIPIIMANANKLPRLTDMSYALQRRLLIIPFEVTIEEDKQNKELATLLKKELPGIFNWVLQGLNSLRDNEFKLHIPEKVHLVVDNYVRENNALRLWIEARRMYSLWNPSTKPTQIFSLTGVLYRDFVVWCDDNGYERIDLRSFRETMKSLGYEHKRRSNGYGFGYYVTPSEEEVRVANMDIAVQMQSLAYVECLKKAAENMERMTVIGIEDLERYLGLPENCVWPYLQSGKLDGTFRVSNGRMMFDVQNVQVELAKAGFYQTIKKDETRARKNANNVLKGIRQKFNASMRKLGLPIRKYGNVYGYVPIGDKDCYIVPDDWEYSKRAAEIVLAQRRENLSKLNLEVN